MTTTTERLTLEQFLALPETKPASEYHCGEVIKKTMPTGLHAVVQRLLSFVITRFLLTAGIGESAGSEWRCVFGPARRRRSVVPDFVYIAPERLPRGREALRGPFFGAPDLAVEILLPDDRPSRVTAKILFYLRNGVRLVWLIDPEARTVTVFTPGKDERVLTSGDTLDGGAALPGFSILVDELFPKA